MFNSLRPHRLQPTKLLCPWDSPGKNTGVGCRHWILLNFFSFENNSASEFWMKSELVHAFISLSLLFFFGNTTKMAVNVCFKRLNPMQERKWGKLQVGQYVINDNLLRTFLKNPNCKPRAKMVLRASPPLFLSPSNSITKKFRGTRYLKMWGWWQS